MNAQRGFTLIELVFVIVILGILAALAVPRFIDLTGDARRAAVQGMLGAIRSASALAHASAIARQLERQATGTITAEGTSIDIKYGYPTAGTTTANSGIYNLIQSADNFDITFPAANTVRFTADNAVDANECYVQYVNSLAAPSGTPSITTGDLTNGC